MLQSASPDLSELNLSFFCRWQKIFRSRLLSSFSYYANVYFNIFIIILVVLFFGKCIFAVLQMDSSSIHPQQANFNSLAPGRSKCDSKNGIFNLVLLIGIFRSSHDDALRWMPQDLTDDKSTWVQVMAWCRQATSHYRVHSRQGNVREK